MKKIYNKILPLGAALLLLPLGLWAQDLNISGRVLDGSNEPVAGASVVVKGTTIGVTTGINGDYDISAPADAVLVYAMMGMGSHEEAVNGRGRIDVIMSEDARAIDEVVVVGYGTMRKKDLTGAVSSVKTSEMPVQTMSTVTHALAGKAAGLRIKQSTAQPGAGASFRIRGETSINAGNDPLIVVDGIPVSSSSSPGSGGSVYQSGSQDNVLEMINPSDIESIEILKDASSSAIYGSRAGHGVIIITTKRGATGAPKVTYSGNAAVQTPAGQYNLLSAQEYMQMNNWRVEETWAREYGQGVYADYVTPRTPFVSFDDYKGTRRWYSDQEIKDAKTTDWLQEIMRTGWQQSHNVSVSGGTDKLKTLASVNYFEQEGVLKNSAMKRFTANLNGDYQFTSWAKAGISMNISRNYYDNVPLGMQTNEYAGIIASAINFEPTLPIFDPEKEGKYQESLVYNQTPNPVGLLTITDNTTKDRALGSGYLQIEPVAGLTIKGALGFDRRSAKRKIYLPTTTRMGAIANGFAHQNQSDAVDYLMNLTANYTKTLGEHNFTLLAGYEYQLFTSEWFSAEGKNQPKDVMLYNKMNALTQDRSVDSWAGVSSLASVFGRVNYSYAGRYLITATLRSDGASNFNPDYRWGYFPSVSAAWRFGDEGFMESIKGVVSNGKLRVSYGQTGNSNVGSRALDYFGITNKYAFGSTGYNGIGLTTLGNPKITWETTSEWNFGIDLGFLDNRLNLSVEYYDRVISDLLVTERSLPSYSEMTSIADNIGKTRGQGIEITLNTVNVRTSEWLWTTDLTFYHYEDRWEERAPSWVPAAYQKEKDPIRAIHEYVSQGLLKAGEPAPAWQTGLLPGMIKIQNINDDPNAPNQLSNLDMVLIGDRDPDFSFGFNNTVRYKAFDLNIDIYGEIGRWRDASYYDYLIPFKMGDFGTGVNRAMRNGSANGLNSWRQDNQNTDVPSILNASASLEGDYFLRKVSFLRCRSITLGYTIPVPKRIFSSIRVYASVNNPFVISNWNGIDPETDYNPVESGYEKGNAISASYPSVRTFSMGVDISF